MKISASCMASRLRPIVAFGERREASCVASIADAEASLVKLREKLAGVKRALALAEMLPGDHVMDVAEPMWRELQEASAEAERG